MVWRSRHGWTGCLVAAVAVLSLVAAACEDEGAETGATVELAGPTGEQTQTRAPTGEAETGPTGSPDAEWDGFDLPPDGAVPSSPGTGKVVARCCPVFSRSVFVYADGRVLTSRPGGFVEQRLTPEGIDLFRSGAVDPRRFLRPRGPSLPAGAWADPDARPYVPSRYAICYARISGGEHLGYVDPSRVVSLLPARAQDLLRGKEQDLGDEGRLRSDRRCSVLTTEEARTLEQILLDVGFEGFVTPEAVGDKVGDEVWMFTSSPLFPHE